MNEGTCLVCRLAVLWGIVIVPDVCSFFIFVVHLVPAGQMANGTLNHPVVPLASGIFVYFSFTNFACGFLCAVFYVRFFIPKMLMLLRVVL